MTGVQLINHGTQIPGRKCFSFYVHDVDCFVSVAGAQTFDSIKEFMQLCETTGWSKSKIKKFERLYNSWVRNN